MKKVKLTREQAEAIEEYKKAQIAQHKEIKENPLKLVGWVHPLVELETDEFMDALYEGYEVEPEFKVGDWVYDAQYNKVAPIERVEVNRVWVDDDELNFYSIEDVRHATPEEIAEEKERRWWKKNGREPWGLKKYDRIKCKTTDKEYEILDVEKPLRFKVLDMRDVHLRNIEFYSTQQISSRFVVVCFTENRLDVKTND